MRGEGKLVVEVKTAEVGVKNKGHRDVEGGLTITHWNGSAEVASWKPI